MTKINCWEYFTCGRQTGGARERELGTCPAAVQKSLHGVNRGSSGGRSCWAIPGTLCRGKIQGTYAQKLGDCLQCGFFAFVRFEEGEDFVSSRDILKKINTV